MSIVYKCDGGCGKDIEYVLQYLEPEDSKHISVLPISFTEEIITEKVTKNKQTRKTTKRKEYNFCSWNCVGKFSATKV